MSSGKSEFKTNTLPYRYNSLPGAHSIRVLHVNPGNGAEPVSGILETVDLRDNPAYEALSYEWGSQERELEFIIDNDYTLGITRSLYDALRDIRHVNAQQGPRTIWADALCINQDDVYERQQQVSFMGSIYRSGRRVVTYIGPEKDNSSLGIDFAYELIQHWDRHSDEPPDPRLHDTRELANMGLPPFEDPKWEAFRKLITRGWAGRCWCAQEFVLNRNTTMMCGRKVINGVFVLPLVVSLVFNRLLPSFTIPSTSEDPNSLRECLVVFREMRDVIVEKQRSVSMLYLLMASHPLLATDPRDKIYSLLGLASDSAALSINVDYTCSVAELYTKVAASIMSLKNSTALLYHKLGKESQDLPSWVPDWSSWRFGSHGMVTAKWYRACGSTRPRFRIEMPDGLLHISGCIVDRVCGLNDMIGADCMKADYPDHREWLETQFSLLSHLKTYPNGVPLSEVFWRTLIANLTLYEKHPESDYEQYFSALQTVDSQSPAKVRDMAREYRDSIRRKLRWRRLCTTEKGYFGAIPDTAQMGDLICMFEGTRSLFAIREKGSRFSLIGSAYVHGLMNGEVLKMEGYEIRMLTLC